MNHKLIGLVGLKTSGKNYITKLVSENMLENRLGLTAQFAFADTLYRGASSALGIPFLASKSYSGKDKEMLRVTLNSLGISGRYFNGKQWLIDRLVDGVSNYFSHHAQNSDALAIVTDVRLPEEVERLRSLGGRIVLIFNQKVYQEAFPKLIDHKWDTDPSTMSALDFEKLAFLASRYEAGEYKDPDVLSASKLIDYVVSNNIKDATWKSPHIDDFRRWIGFRKENL